MAILKRGVTVKQIVPVIQGSILESRIVEDDINYLIEYTDAAGETHERWFKESELEVVA